MNAFKLPLISKLLLGGAGGALLSMGVLGASGPVVALAAAPAAHARNAHTPDSKKDHRAVARAVFEAEADALGMTPEQLRDALKKGRTVKDLANDRGLTKEQLVDRMLNHSGLRAALDHLVDAKQITRAQADRVLDRIAKGHVPGWDGEHHDRKAGKKAKNG